jgi:hypothetical protein
MDAIELLGQLGQVEPADQAVLDAALRRFAEHTGRRRRQIRGPRLTLAAAGAIAAAAAAVFALPSTTPTQIPTSVRTTGPAPTGVAAILTAFEASRNDILQVTKTMAGPEGTLGKTIIWIDPLGARKGSTVQSRTLSFTLAGAREQDLALRYTESRLSHAPCDEFFERPRITTLPAPGLRGSVTIVYYPGHFWGQAAVAVQAATVPSASLRACLRAGNWRELGRPVLGKTKTTEFAATGLPVSGYEHLWVNSATYLPVRLVTFNGAEKITFGFRFLPPTPANKALLRVRIPAGFKKRRF